MSNKFDTLNNQSTQPANTQTDALPDSVAPADAPAPIDWDTIDWEAKILELARAQQREAQLKKTYGDYINQIDTARNHKKQIEDELRDLARRCFNETGVDAMHEALTVKVRIKTEYRLEDNLEAVIEYAPQLLLIDMVAFKKMIESGSAPWAISTIRDEPVPFLSQKLGEYVIKDTFNNK